MPSDSHHIETLNYVRFSFLLDPKEVVFMFRMHSLSALFVLTLVMGTSQAQAQTTMELKFPDGQKTKSAVKVTTKQTLMIAGQTVETGSEQELVISSVNGKRGADGVLKQQQKIESLTAKISLPGGVSLEFDSTKPDAPASGTMFDAFLDIIKANSKAAWTVTRGKDNRVVSIEGREKILEGLDEAKQALLKKQIDPVYLREVANKEIEKVPAKPVNVGDTWTVTETLRLDQGQSMTFKTKYTYAGTVDREGVHLEQIDTSVEEVKFALDADGGLPLKLKSAELTPTTQEGLIYFDRAKGAIIENRSTVQIKGTLNFEANNMELPAQLDLTMSNSSVVQ